MPDVDRLDFSQPPPGFQPFTLPGKLRWVLETDGACGPIPLLAAWSKYKADNAPPGVPAYRVARVAEWYGAVTARAAAWAWYERMIELTVKVERWANFMLSIGTRTSFNPWPRCLTTWTDHQAEEVESWLDDGGKLPEVLRG